MNVQNSKRSFSATPEPKLFSGILSPKLLIAACLWLAFVVWVFCDCCISVGQAGRYQGDNPFSPRAAYDWLAGFDAWAGLAALGLLFIGTNPYKWRNVPRLVLGTTFFAMMLGRFGCGTVTMLPLPAYDWISLVGQPFMLAAAGVAIMLAVGLVIGVLAAIFFFVPITMLNQLFAFERSIAVYRYNTNSLSGRIAGFMYWLRNETRPEPLPDESRGARFATPPEIRSQNQPKSPIAMAYGQHDGAPLFLDTQKHVLIMASTRSGKGVSLIIPHLLRYRGSAFVLDPKGENARATGRQRAALNGEVHYLDPFGISGKPQSRFNPLTRFTSDNMEAESKALAAALFIVGERERDHWNASGQQLLAALILYVYAEPNIPREKKDLNTVRKLLLGNIVPTLESMRETDFADGLLRDLAKSFLDTPDKERGSIISTAQRQTEILDNPFIAACLAATGPGQEVDFAFWRAGTMTVYLCLSAPKFPTFARWLRLVLTSALDEMTDQLDPPPLPVCFLLDEMATLGHLQPIENAVGLAAGYGIQLDTSKNLAG